MSRFDIIITVYDPSDPKLLADYDGTGWDMQTKIDAYLLDHAVFEDLPFDIESWKVTEHEEA